jgi:ribosomal protein S18 acetylase RimI-like enzyme
LRPACPSPEASSGTSVSIRSAQPEDVGFVRSLCRRVFLAYGSYDDYVAEWFSSAEVSTWVAELDSVLAGFCMSRIHPAELGREVAAELLAIAVVPELQTRGVGKALLGKCFAAAREREPPALEVRLSVADGNSRAQRMFASSGFRMAPSSGIYPAGQRALFMVKTLSPARGEETR